MWFAIGYAVIGVLTAVSVASYNEYIYDHFRDRNWLESGYLGVAAGVAWPFFWAAVSARGIVYCLAWLGSYVARRVK